MRLFSDPASGVADPMLARALYLADHGRGRTAPNPMVGCVLVSDGRMVGEGFHRRAGAPHAEAEALAQAGDAARGSTAYVTLEPCNHQGRTPPCTEALIAAGVAKVVIGMRDPNPDVAGGGADRLARAGIEVLFAEDPEPFERLNEAWLKWLRTGMPWLDVKVALTLDGRASLAKGFRTIISGPEAGEISMRLRSSADAVAVGAATQAVDDPLLTVRRHDGSPSSHQPLRVVVCRTACPSPESRLVNASAGRVLVLVPERRPVGCDALEAAGVECAAYDSAGGLEAALRVLGEREIRRVLLESGPGMFTAAMSSESIDRLVLVHAGGMGGAGAPALFLGEGVERSGALLKTMRCVETGLAGDDAVTVWERIADR